ncbi:MAG: hypothetical protein FWE74_08260 [Oscillospiraceae bacterium]|nr:hypothetical protein [Oscillospiraceae bacterium]
MERTVFIVLIILALLVSACAAEEPLKNPPPADYSPPVTTTLVLEEAVPTFSDNFMDEPPRELDYTEVNFRIRTNNITTDTSWIEFELNNRSDVEYIYGEHFVLSEFTDGSWEAVDIIHGAQWSEMGIILMPDSINNGSIDIGYFFGFLSEGEYKIEKILFSEYDWGLVSTEFEVFEIEK